MVVDDEGSLPHKESPTPQGRGGRSFGSPPLGDGWRSSAGESLLRKRSIGARDAEWDGEEGSFVHMRFVKSSPLWEGGAAGARGHGREKGASASRSGGAPLLVRRLHNARPPNEEATLRPNPKPKNQRITWRTTPCSPWPRRPARSTPAQPPFRSTTPHRPPPWTDPWLPCRRPRLQS